MATRTRYTTVPLDDPADEIDRKKKEELELARKGRKEKVKTYENLLHSVFWIAASIFVLYYSNLPYVIVSDPRVNRVFLSLGIICFTVISFVTIYVTIYIPLNSRIKGVPPPSDSVIYSTDATHTKIGAAAIVGMFFSSVVTIWPIWGFISLPICLVLGFGSIMLISIIPFPC